MKSKLTKWIIVIVVFIVAAIGSLLGVSLLTNASTTTVNDIRLLSASSNEELFSKEVYLTASSHNYFDVKLDASASSILKYRVVSSNPEVATVVANGNNYRVRYLKVGETTITATTLEASNIKDSFVLKVKEYVPTNFVITEEDRINDLEVKMFADNRDYRFSFEASQGSIEENINISSLEVVGGFNTNVFSSVYIDAGTQELVVKAKQSEAFIKEYITIQSKRINAEGKKETVATFVVCVNVYGNYISDIQLMLSSVPNFDVSPNICGEGLLKEGETRIGGIYLTKEVHIIYARVRAVYTNGEMFDVTSKSSSSTISGNPNTSRPALGGYYSIDVQGETAGIKFSYGGVSEDVSFNYLDEVKTPATYVNFFENQLYKKLVDEETGVTYYEYVYWDTRYKRTDTVTDKAGRIIDFMNGAPACGE